MEDRIYDFPISEQIGTLQTMMAEEHDKMILRAVQKIGIQIDQDSLVQAIKNDRQRYEEAYKKGYADCERKFNGLLAKIRILASEGEEQE